MKEQLSQITVAPLIFPFPEVLILQHFLYALAKKS